MKILILNLEIYITMTGEDMLDRSTFRSAVRNLILRDYFEKWHCLENSEQTKFIDCELFKVWTGDEKRDMNNPSADFLSKIVAKFKFISESLCDGRPSRGNNPLV